MAAEIVQITPQDFLSQNYQTQDVNLITSFAVSTFLSSSSYIEFFIMIIIKISLILIIILLNIQY
jgi:hypothetical protein